MVVFQRFFSIPVLKAGERPGSAAPARNGGPRSALRRSAWAEVPSPAPASAAAVPGVTPVGTMLAGSAGRYRGLRVGFTPRAFKQAKERTHRRAAARRNCLTRLRQQRPSGRVHFLGRSAAAAPETQDPLIAIEQGFPFLVRAQT